MKKAFISYCKNDRAFAYRTREAAKALGWIVLLDEEFLHPGSPWPEQLVNRISAADVFIVVFTSCWGKQRWPQIELEQYHESCNDRAVHPTVIALEFEPSALTVQLRLEQIVKSANALSACELSWVLHCGGEKLDLGPRDSWESQGRKVRRYRADESYAEKPTLSYLEQVRLYDKLVEIKSADRITRILLETFGYLPEGISSNPKVAWYQIVRLADTKGLIPQLCRASQVEWPLV